ncbi:hypothetical protein AB0C10_17870 [Microbispora amethystogenes]|uniref:hypothetical protein n=1 Tax=Microbispora amethystogenes TaxID=1427754 RepID=UPI00340A5337
MTAPESVARGEELYRRPAALEDAAVADPRIDGLAADLVAQLPPGLAAALGTAMPCSAHPFAGAFLDGLSPAQAEVVRRAMDLLTRQAAR